MEAGQALLPVKAVHGSSSNSSARELTADTIALWAPVLLLHPEERYLPSSAEWFIARSSLWLHPHGKHKQEGSSQLLPVGHVTAEVLEGLQEQHPHHELVLHLGEEHHHGIEAHALDDAPVYVHAKLVVDDDGAAEAYEIAYMNFHPYNGTYNLCGLPCLHAGHHVGDWEHLTVRLHASDLQLQGVWYNSHRNLEGEWAEPHQVPRTVDGRIVSYLAHNGHGHYPRAGTTHRLFFVANDYTSGAGRVWRPRRLHLMTGLSHKGSIPTALTRGSSLPRRLLQPTPPLPPPATAAAACPVSSIPPPSSGMPASVAQATEVVAAEGSPKRASFLQPFNRHSVHRGWDLFLNIASCCERGTNGGSDVMSAEMGQGPQVLPVVAGPLPAVVHDDGAWQRFKGQWGTSDPPAVQYWFHHPEPPISRGYIRRLLLPLAKGVHRLPPLRPPPPPALAGRDGVEEVRLTILQRSNSLVQSRDLGVLGNGSGKDMVSDPAQNGTHGTVGGWRAMLGQQLRQERSVEKQS